MLLASLKSTNIDDRLDKSIGTLIDVARSLIKQNGDQIITQEILFFH